MPNMPPSVSETSAAFHSPRDKPLPPAPSITSRLSWSSGASSKLIEPDGWPEEARNRSRPVSTAGARNQPGGNGRGALHVAQAALGPAHSAVGANARRLGRAALRRGRAG